MTLREDRASVVLKSRPARSVMPIVWKYDGLTHTILDGPAIAVAGTSTSRVQLMPPSGT